MEALRNYIEKDLEDNQDLLDMIKKNCLNTESTDVCGFKQVHLCMLKQSIDVSKITLLIICIHNYIIFIENYFGLRNLIIF